MELGRVLILGLGDVSIEPRPIFQREGFHARRRKGAGLDPGGIRENRPLAIGYR
jgi:hypothetical protein